MFQKFIKKYRVAENVFLVEQGIVFKKIPEHACKRLGNPFFQKTFLVVFKVSLVFNVGFQPFILFEISRTVMRANNVIRMGLKKTNLFFKFSRICPKVIPFTDRNKFTPAFI